MWISWAALYSFWGLALLSIAGAVAWRRRRRLPTDRARRVPAARAGRRRVRDRARHVREHTVPHDRGAVDRGARRARDRRRRSRGYAAATRRPGTDRCSAATIAMIGPCGLTPGRLRQQRRVVHAQVVVAPDPPEAVGAGAGPVLADAHRRREVHRHQVGAVARERVPPLHEIARSCGRCTPPVTEG